MKRGPMPSPMVRAQFVLAEKKSFGCTEFLLRPTVVALRRYQPSPCAGSSWLAQAAAVRLSEKVPSPYNRPFPFHRFVLRRTQHIFPFGAGIVLIQQRSVANLKVAVDCAIEASCTASMAKLRRWEFADWANECHGCA
jgi:hypothetical protein